MLMLLPFCKCSQKNKKIQNFRKTQKCNFLCSEVIIQMKQMLGCCLLPTYTVKLSSSKDLEISDELKWKNFENREVKMFSMK
jgi:hypothetical protein